MHKTDAKERILEQGSAIVHKKGFHHTGIQEILQAAGIPKGSFYFYFKNKEEFGLELIDYYTNIFFSKYDGYLSSPNLSPVNKLREFFADYLDFFLKNDFQGGCPLGNLAQEMGDQNMAFQEKLNDIFSQIIERIADLLKEAQEMGEISVLLNVSEAAEFVFNSWQGAIIKMKTARTTDSLRILDKMIFDYLLKF